MSPNATKNVLKKKVTYFTLKKHISIHVPTVRRSRSFVTMAWGGC